MHLNIFKVANLFLQPLLPSADPTRVLGQAIKYCEIVGTVKQLASPNMEKKWAGKQDSAYCFLASPVKNILTKSLRNLLSGISLFSNVPLSIVLISKIKHLQGILLCVQLTVMSIPISGLYQNQSKLNEAMIIA